MVWVQVWGEVRGPGVDQNHGLSVLIWNEFLQMHTESSSRWDWDVLSMEFMRKTVEVL